NKDRKRFSTSDFLGSSIQSRGDRSRQAVPARCFLTQPATASGGERVVLCPAIILALAPFSGDQILVFQPVQRGIQGPLRDIERLSRNLLNAKQHAISVQRLQGDGFEDQHVERAGQQVCAFVQGWWPPSPTRSIARRSRALLYLLMMQANYYEPRLENRDDER